jgi:hypothetical protein
MPCTRPSGTLPTVALVRSATPAPRSSGRHDRGAAFRRCLMRSRPLMITVDPRYGTRGSAFLKVEGGAPLPGQTCIRGYWPCGAVGDVPASSKRSGKSTGLTLAAAHRWTSSDFRLRHTCSIKTLSSQLPRRSMPIRALAGPSLLVLRPALPRWIIAHVEGERSPPC